jgi:hypothetical protein
MTRQKAAQATDGPFPPYVVIITGMRRLPDELPGMVIGVGLLNEDVFGVDAYSIYFPVIARNQANIALRLHY